MSTGLLSVRDAASILGVSRRRVEAMILNELLPAERVGHQWVISRSSLVDAEHNLWREPGRPLSQAAAWEQIAGFEVSLPTEIPDLDRMRRRLRARAKHSYHFAHPSLLEKLETHPGVIKGGRHAAALIGLPIDPIEHLDAYVRESEVHDMLAKHQCRKVELGHNLTVHAVEDDVWPFGLQDQSVSGLVIWLDLADARDRAADTALAGINRQDHRV